MIWFCDYFLADLGLDFGSWTLLTSLDPWCWVWLHKNGWMILIIVRLKFNSNVVCIFFPHPSSSHPFLIALDVVGAWSLYHVSKQMVHKWLFVIRWSEPGLFFLGMLVCILRLCLQNVAVSKSRHQLLFYPTRKGKKHRKIPFFRDFEYGGGL